MPQKIPLPRVTPLQLEEMIIQLCGDTRFRVFVEELRGMREAAINDLCNDAVIENHAKTAAAVGEIRTYTGILSLVDAHIQQGSSLQD